jgi:hypothetical protein
MLRIQLLNTGKHPKHPEYGEYKYWVDVNGHTIAKGMVTGHKRSDGWKMLLKLLAEQGES